MDNYNEVFSKIFQFRIRDFLEISISDNALKQQVMGRIFQRGKQIYENNPASLTEAVLVAVAKQELLDLISIPTGISTAVLMQNMTAEEQKTAVLLYQENRNVNEIARELNISKVRVLENIDSGRQKLEEKLRNKEIGEGITAVGFIIGMLYRYPVTVTPAVITTPGINPSAPQAITAGGRTPAATPVSNAPVSSPYAYSSAVPEAVRSGAGQAVGSPVVYNASNAGPVPAAGGMTTARIAIVAAIALTIVGGGVYGIARVIAGDNNKSEPVYVPNETTAYDEERPPVSKDSPAAVKRIKTMSYGDVTQEFYYVDNSVYPSKIVQNELGEEKTFEFSYTEDHELTKKEIIDADGREISADVYEYDSDGNMIRSRHVSSGQTTEFHYTRDNRDRIVSLTYGDPYDGPDTYTKCIYEYEGDDTMTVTETNDYIGVYRNYVYKYEKGRYVPTHMEEEYMSTKMIWDYEYVYFAGNVCIRKNISNNVFASAELLLFDSADKHIMDYYGVGSEYHADAEGYPLIDQIQNNDAVITYEMIGG